MEGTKVEYRLAMLKDLDLIVNSTDKYSRKELSEILASKGFVCIATTIEGKGTLTRNKVVGILSVTFPHRSEKNLGRFFSDDENILEKVALFDVISLPTSVQGIEHVLPGILKQAENIVNTTRYPIFVVRLNYDNDKEKLMDSLVKKRLYDDKRVRGNDLLYKKRFNPFMTCD
jgi:hypothetical protein